MTDSRMPNFWWCPTHHLYRGGAERPCVDAVKLGDVDALREELDKATRQRDSLARRCAKYFETQQKLEGDLAESDESFEQAMAQLKAYTEKLRQARREPDALRAEIRAVLAGWEDRSTAVDVVATVRAIVELESPTRCVNDTNGDGDCAACARNPNALCCQPITSESAVQP